MDNNFRERLGVGRRQMRDSVVSDMTRTHKIIVPGEHKPVAATLVEHRSGRVDATVYVDPIHTSREEAEAARIKLGLSRDEFRHILDTMFGFPGRINHARR